MSEEWRPSEQCPRIEYRVKTLLEHLGEDVKTCFDYEQHWRRRSLGCVVARDAIKMLEEDLLLYDTHCLRVKK
jgi:hypothetical protein